MVKRIIFVTMSILSFFGCCKTNAVKYPSDTIEARDGSQIKFVFYSHASIAIEWNGVQMYFDPVGENIDWKRQPKADLIFVTHSHFDHFDLATVETLSNPSCEILCDKTTADALEHECITMLPGSVAKPRPGIEVRAVRAYNTSEGHTQFHPKEREDCGYIVTLGGTNIYIAGDTEDNEDVLALSDIDIAFLPVNQPYTMTVEQAVNVVKSIKPAIFYPYHYGGTDVKTDIDSLCGLLEGITDVRIRPLE